MSWHPVIGACKDDCFKCLNFCPKGVFEKDGNRPVVSHPDNCVDGCEGCKSVCPVDGITFTRSNGIIVDGQEIGLQGLDAALQKESFDEAWQIIIKDNYVPDAIKNELKEKLKQLFGSKD